ncbi:hypothetical protein ElyMa_006907300 [Elysia marginata]|uniref:SH3 domain-containing protein n=1 Tax=Elysia marginata TaxID=1093978 RepID=A0AAV4JD70_9GAST|nr:hypothetical protein ElyMa_006907300 [Elysia marginata]
MDQLAVGGFQLANLLLAFLVTSVFVFLLYWLWTWPCRLAVGGFQLANLLLAFLVTSVFVFLLYWLWTWPCSEQGKGFGSDKPRKYDSLQLSPGPAPAGIPVATLYAMEIEPGTVVLQSEDGEFFRILREFDKVERPGGYGSMTREPTGSSMANQYVPSYTRAHYQTRPALSNATPSAPPASHLAEVDQWRARCDAYGPMEPWRPLHTANVLSGY